MTDRERTLDAIQIRWWRVVLLYPNSKKPAAAAGESWPVTDDLPRIAGHLEPGGLGLLGGELNGVAIIDIDRPDLFAEMEAALGHLDRWVQTGSGKSHVYVGWEARLPAKLMWRGHVVGELQRGPGLQHAVMPPSVHPVSLRPYVWLVDPATHPIRPLPSRWRKHILEPARVKIEDHGLTPDGFASLREAALAQPGAKQRASGQIKFGCPACMAEGYDEPRDNAVLFPTGAWGCAWAAGTSLGRLHWERIGHVLGALTRRLPWRHA